MKTTKSFRHTKAACYIGYITQAIINNFAPLLFLTFESSYGIPLSKITILIAANFAVQLLVDLIAARFVDKIGYRPCVVAAHLLCAVGLAGLGILPGLLPDPFIGITVAILIYALGGGLIEVLISPMIEACPSDGKVASMGLLHSFYCWGQAAVILLSTLFFATVGISHWNWLAILWAIVPLFNAFYFLRVPINQLPSESEGGSTLGKLFTSGLFWLFFILMFLAGASEQNISQWASAFAESVLLSSEYSAYAKTLGDLMGPCLFALMTGVSRLLYAKMSKKLDLRKMMLCSGILCVLCYLIAALAPSPMLSLVGCGLCGFTVGIMWPGVLSLTSMTCPGASTATFAMLALAGDLGCSLGPSAVGFISDLVGGGDLKVGLTAAVIFPVLLVAALIVCGFVTGRKK